MTAATDKHPTVRSMTTRRGDQYVVTIAASVITIRPKGTRSAKVRVPLDIGALYVRSLMAQVDAERRERARARRAKIAAGGRTA